MDAVDILSGDTFWTTIIHYLSIQDCYNLELANSSFINAAKKRLEVEITKKIIEYYGQEDYRKLRELTQHTNISITGKIIEDIFEVTTAPIFSSLICLFGQCNEIQTVISLCSSHSLEFENNFIGQIMSYTNCKFTEQSNKKFLVVVNNDESPKNIFKMTSKHGDYIYVIQLNWLYE
jgi:alpha-galactosidase